MLSTSRPVVTPSQYAVKCLNTVLAVTKARDNARGVLEQLVIDSLLCFSRAHAGATVNFSYGVLPPDEQLSWKHVRKILHGWWPVSCAPTSGVKPLPRPGTVSLLSHPCRAVWLSTWAIDVDMSGVADALRKVKVSCERQSDASHLPAFESVSRVGPKCANSVAPLGTSVATLLLIGTKEGLLVQHLRRLHLCGSRAGAESSPDVVSDVP